MTNLKFVLERCRDQFRSYEQQHRAKGTHDGANKAVTNAQFAEMCEKALADIDKGETCC